MASAGCEAAAAAQVVKERRDLTVGGEERFYLLTAPEGRAPQPLIVDLHGFMEGAEVHTVQSALGEYGLGEGFVTAFPHGTGDPVRWRADQTSSPDLAFIDAVLEDVGAHRCIDTSRIYATGLSMGATMTSLLACTRADRFAAFAPVNGLRLPEGCDPGRPIPLLTFHGTADPILLFNGGVDTSSFTGGEPGVELPEADLDGEGYPATARAWAALQDCGAEPVDTEDGDSVIERVWPCPEGAAVEFVIIRGQGHGWPGSEFAESIATFVGPTVEGVDANERMWEFFQRHHLPA